MFWWGLVAGVVATSLTWVMYLVWWASDVEGDGGATE